MPRLSAVLAGLGAILFALWFASELRGAVPLYESLPLYESAGEGSGGIGAVSVGFFGAEPMMFVAAIVANRLIARWTRTSGSITRRMHVIHSIAIVMVPILVIMWIAAVLSGLLSPGGQVVAAAVFSIMTLYIRQLGLMSVLLALFAWQRTRPALTSG